MEITATERCKCTAGPVVEFAHPLHKVETGSVNRWGKDSQCDCKHLNEEEQDQAEQSDKNTSDSTACECVNHWLEAHSDGHFCNFDAGNTDGHNAEVRECVG